MVTNRPILVTGSHRSGSTWVGKMIAASPAVGYINEPFNVRHSPGVCSARFVRWFTYVTDENAASYYRPLKNTFEFRCDLIGALKAIRCKNDVKRVSKEVPTFFLYRLRQAVPLVKDPIAVLSTEWLARTFDMQVLVLVRHPAAFASSLKRLHWTFLFSHFLQQPLLTRDYLHPFETQIREFAGQEYDIIDQAALLWTIIHRVIIEYRNRHPDWVLLRHEDISLDPLGHVQNLFVRFNLDFSPQVERAIWEYSNAANPGEVTENVSTFLKRESAANIWNWKNRLSALEIERIRERVEDTAKEFYSINDW